MVNFRTLTKEMVEILLASGFSVNYIVDYLGVPKTTLYRWKTEIENNPNSLFNLSKVENLDKLRKKLRLQLENELEEAANNKNTDMAELFLKFQRLTFLYADANISTEIKVLSNLLRELGNGHITEELHIVRVAIADYLCNRLAINKTGKN